jgi:hypothetical protein
LDLAQSKRGYGHAPVRLIGTIMAIMWIPSWKAVGGDESDRGGQWLLTRLECLLDCEDGGGSGCRGDSLGVMCDAALAAALVLGRCVIGMFYVRLAGVQVG